MDIRSADMPSTEGKYKRRRSERLSNNFDHEESLNIKQNLRHIIHYSNEGKKVNRANPGTTPRAKRKKKEAVNKEEISLKANEVHNKKHPPSYLKKEAVNKEEISLKANEVRNQKHPPSYLKKEADEKKEISLTAKEVFNEKHPPCLTQRQKLCWIQENRVGGTWVQCTVPTCKKWRYLEDIIDPTTVPSGWTCYDSHDNNFNSCFIPTSPDLNGKVLITLKYDAGSVVLARSARKGAKWWPAMIDDDPHYEQFYWPGKDRIATSYHVVYFDEPGEPLSRDWRNENAIKKFIPEVELKYESHYKKRIKAAHEAACMALKLSVIERLKEFSFIRRYTGPSLAGLSEWIKDYYYWKGYVFEDDSDCTISSSESSSGDESDMPCSSIASGSSFNKISTKKRRYNKNNAGKKTKDKVNKNKIMKRKHTKIISSRSSTGIRRTLKNGLKVQPNKRLTDARVKLENVVDSDVFLNRRRNRVGVNKRVSRNPEQKKIKRKNQGTKVNNRIISVKKKYVKKKSAKKTDKLLSKSDGKSLAINKHQLRGSDLNKIKINVQELEYSKKANYLSKDNHPPAPSGKLQNFGGEGHGQGLRKTPSRQCKDEGLNYFKYWWHGDKITKSVTKSEIKKRQRRNSSFHVKKKTNKKRPRKNSLSRDKESCSDDSDSASLSGYYSDYLSTNRYASVLRSWEDKGFESG